MRRQIKAYSGKRFPEKKKAERRPKKSRKDAELQAKLLTRIPADYIDLFPMARSIRRHFVLHLGPTNSGKTHEAMEALREAGSGIYLGPLRLLAYEQYEQMNRDGFPCSLVTGEERYEAEGACFQSSTIEMLPLAREFSCAVIDEAQMCADRDRGGAWTAAILGVCAPEVHVCAALYAKDLLIRMITECGDSYELVMHERLTPLLVENARYRMSHDTKKGDALIVFSRKNVHAVAAELHERGFKTSIIYGALPYDVRHEQARLFSAGETDVVVATDAIGMGMNLPIRRIVFLENDKFDGISRRPLEDEEIRQIAGRAGRYGRYPEGYVTSEAGRKQIRNALETESLQLQAAVIGFPETLLSIDLPLVEILRRWDRLSTHPGYIRADTKRMIALCEMIQDLSTDRNFLYRCLMLTFDEDDEKLLSHWKDMCAAEARGKKYRVAKYIPDDAKISAAGSSLDELEYLFRLCDLLYSYCERFSHPEHREELMLVKNRISKAILSILSKQRLSPRRCRFCGRRIPWNHPYAMCESCYRRRYRRY